MVREGLVKKVELGPHFLVFIRGGNVKNDISSSHWVKSSFLAVKAGSYQVINSYRAQLCGTL